MSALLTRVFFPRVATTDLHIGHALNKILKDFVCRYEALKGKRVRFVPGWDCHGLPIELKVLQSMDKEKRAELTPIKLRKKARNFALKTVDAQREQARSVTTLVPIRPRSRGERRSLRTLSPGVRLSPPRVPRFQSRHTSTPFNSASDAFQLHPAVAKTHFARTTLSCVAPGEGSAARAARRTRGRTGSSRTA